MASFALMIASVTRDRGEVGQEGAEAVDGRAVFGALGRAFRSMLLYDSQSMA